MVTGLCFVVFVDFSLCAFASLREFSFFRERLQNNFGT